MQEEEERLQHVVGLGVVISLRFFCFWRERKGEGGMSWYGNWRGGVFMELWEGLVDRGCS